MKIRFLAFILLPILNSCAPSGSNKRDVQNTRFDSFEMRYHYIINGCDTYPRMAATQEQYCRNLQWDDANNGCALEARKETFEAHCPGQTWNPEATVQKIFSTPGIYSICTLSDGTPTQIDLNNGRYINKQQMVDAESILPHSGVYARILQKFGTLEVTMQLMTNDGVKFAEKTVTTTGIHELTSLTPESRLVCDVQVREEE